MNITHVSASGLRISISVDDKEVARAHLYLLKNDLHEQPFGLVEDVFVDEAYRSCGAGGRLLGAIIEEAKSANCYKLIATSRSDGTRESVHAWYKRLGFLEWGTEFRMNF